MQSFSTAAFVAALALAPSALAANIVSKTMSYATSDCTGDSYQTQFTNYVLALSMTETAAATYCETLAQACTETDDDDATSYAVITCVDSIDVGSSSGVYYYAPTDTTCSTPGQATVYSDCVDPYSMKLDCTDTALNYLSCDEASCGGTCTDSGESVSTTCTLDDNGYYYQKAFCGSSDDVCFSGDDTLLLESGKAKRLSEVAIGDKVQTADANGVLSFSEVVALPHAANNKLASFVNVATASGKSVKATKMHLLQQCDGSLAYAGSLAAGDCLRTVDGDEAVTAVSMTKAEGIYTAVTTNEFLVVNGIVASPFAVTHGLTNAYYNAHRFVAKVFPSALKSPLVLAVNAFLGGAFLTAGGSK